MTAPAGDGPDPGSYGPSSEAWRLNREAMLLLGAGPRALLLQIAHPSVAAGVDEHSDFRSDPWARLLATIRSYLRIVYGTTGAARSEIRRLNGDASGDPRIDLQRARSRAVAVGPRDARGFDDRRLRRLGRAAAARSNEPRSTTRLDRSPARSACPRPLLPPDLAAFERYLERMLAPDGPVQVSDTARELGRAVLRPPLAPLATWLPGGSTVRPWLARVPASTYAWTLWPAVGLLPERIRDAYEIDWGVRERLVSSWLVAGWRAWRPVLPDGFRQMPAARAADRRVAVYVRRRPEPGRSRSDPASSRGTA